MKFYKRLTALFFSLVVAFSLSVNTLAAESYTDECPNTEYQAKVFWICYKSYQIGHTFFNIFWSIDLISNKIMWWVCLGFSLIFVLILLCNSDLRKRIDHTPRSMKSRILTTLWTVSTGISGSVHSPWL